MPDRPIIFSAPMVRALLEGRKTQTRRELKPLPEVERADYVMWPVYDHVRGRFQRCGSSPLPDRAALYAPGDRLWVREGHVFGYELDDNQRPIGERKVWYRATDSRLTWYDDDAEATLDNPPWRSPIHMPRWASRLTLIVTQVRVQRLQQISEEDARAEGIEGSPINDLHWKDYQRLDQWIVADPRRSFASLWNSLHGPAAWDANPWVAAITFTVEKRNIDA